MNAEHPQREKAARYAAILRERIETKGILAELQGYPNFIVWRYHIVDGQRKKPPFNPNTNLPASPIEPRTWGTLETALTALATGKFRVSGLCSLTVRLAALILTTALQKERYNLGRKPLLKQWIPTPSIRRHGTKQQEQVESICLLKGNQREVKKLAISRYTGKSTISPSPPTTFQIHQQLSTAGRKHLTLFIAQLHHL